MTVDLSPPTGGTSLPKGLSESIDQYEQIFSSEQIQKIRVTQMSENLVKTETKTILN